MTSVNQTVKQINRPTLRMRQSLIQATLNPRKRVKLPLQNGYPRCFSFKKQTDLWQADAVSIIGAGCRRQKFGLLDFNFRPLPNLAHSINSSWIPQMRGLGWVKVVLFRIALNMDQRHIVIIEVKSAHWSVVKCMFSISWFHGKSNREIANSPFGICWWHLVGCQVGYIVVRNSFMIFLDACITKAIMGQAYNTVWSVSYKGGCNLCKTAEVSPKKFRHHCKKFSGEVAP